MDLLPKQQELPNVKNDSAVDFYFDKEWFSCWLSLGVYKKSFKKLMDIVAKCRPHKLYHAILDFLLGCTGPTQAVGADVQNGKPIWKR